MKISTLFLTIAGAALCACLAFGPGFGAAAGQLAAPAEAPVLHVSGAIAHTNGGTDAGAEAAFDLAMLKALPVTEFETTTIWTEGPQKFTGVSLDALLHAVGAGGTTLRAVALNDYGIDIPVADAVPGGPIVAYLLNGGPMSPRNKGPLWIVYPFDQNADYQNETTYSRSIWQLARIEVKD